MLPFWQHYLLTYAVFVAKKATKTVLLVNYFSGKRTFYLAHFVNRVKYEKKHHTDVLYEFFLREKLRLFFFRKRCFVILKRFIFKL